MLNYNPGETGVFLRACHVKRRRALVEQIQIKWLLHQGDKDRLEDILNELNPIVQEAPVVKGKKPTKVKVKNDVQQWRNLAASMKNWGKVHGR